MRPDPKGTCLLAQLTPREEQLLRLLYGVGEKSRYTLEEVGQRFAVTKERVRQMRDKALGRLVILAKRDLALVQEAAVEKGHGHE